MCVYPTKRTCREHAEQFLDFTCDLSCDLHSRLGGFGPGKLGDEDASDLGEADVRGFVEDERDAAASGLDELDAAEEIGDEGIATAGHPGGTEGAQCDPSIRVPGLRTSTRSGKTAMRTSSGSR